MLIPHVRAANAPETRFPLQPRSSNPDHILQTSHHLHPISASKSETANAVQRSSINEHASFQPPPTHPRNLRSPPVKRAHRISPLLSFRSTMATPSPLKAVTLTHVRYRRGDPLGHFLAWVSLIPVFISLGGFVSHFLFRRDLQGLCFALGLLVSQFLNELIKTSVQQSRPATCAALEMCDSHGWPSSHSQYMFFFAAYCSLLFLKSNGRSNSLVVFLVWPPAVLTMYSRVYLGYHTVAQVFAGAALGLVLGAGWYWFVNSILVEYFPAIEDSWIGRYFYIKDTSHIPNVLQFEYENARAARKKLAVD